MANVRNGNTWYVDTAGESLDVLNVRVTSVILTAGAGIAELLLGDGSSVASYPNKTSIKAAAETTVQVILDTTPVVFPNGIRIKTLTSGAQATLLTTTAGN